MGIIIDSNVLFSALIRNSMTRKMILEYGGKFLFPDYIFEELERHKEDLLQKSKMSKTDFDKLLELLLCKMERVPKEALLEFLEDALEMVKNIDQEDALFVACALAYPNSIIWSNDKKLKDVNGIVTMSTKEVFQLLYGDD